MAVPEISVDELAAAAAGAFLLDVRQPDEYVEAHVPGALLVPLDEVPARAGELPADTEILVICRSGARSHRAAEYLIDQHHLTGRERGRRHAGVDRERARHRGGHRADVTDEALWVADEATFAD